jgi:hypothetical protein
VSSILVLPYLSLLVGDYHYPKQGFSKGHIEVYRALVDELLQFHQLK